MTPISRFCSGIPASNAPSCTVRRISSRSSGVRFTTEQFRGNDLSPCLPGRIYSMRTATTPLISKWYWKPAGIQTARWGGTTQAHWPVRTVITPLMAQTN